MTSKDNTKASLLGTIIWMLAAGFFLYEFFLRTLIGTVATQVIADLGLTPSQFALLGSAYYFAYGSMQLPVGIIADKFGVRYTLIFAVIVCAISAFLLATSHTYITALFSRVLMGFGSSFAFVCLLVVVTDWFPRKNFAVFSGISQFIGTMGPLLAAGPLASVLTNLHGDWRYLLNKIGLAGIVLAAFIVLVVKNKPRNTNNQLIFIKPDSGILNNLKKLFQNKQVMYVSIYSATIYAPMALLGAIWGTIYLQAHHFSQNTAANAISVGWLGYAVGCLTLGIFSDLLSRRKLILISCALMGFLASTLIIITNTNSIRIYDLLFFCLGISAAGQSIACAAISEHSNNETKATAFGMNNGAVIILNVLIPPLAGHFIGLSSSQHTGALVPSDFISGFMIMPLLFLLAFINAALFIKETYCKPQREMLILETEAQPPLSGHA